MLALFGLLGAGCGHADTPEARALLRVEDGAVVLPGTLHPETYAGRSDRYHGHHAITSQVGSQYRKALIRTPVPDAAVAEALAGLGLDDGGGIPHEAWGRLGEPEAPEPATRASGDPLRVEVRWGGGPWRPLASLLEDGGRPARLDLRFQDNRRHIPRYGSGCVVCLASCPGAKVGNRGYTMRENEDGPMDFYPVRQALPPEGTEVEVRFSPRPGPPAAPGTSP